MTTFLNALRRETNLTYTENGAVTNKSSLDPIVDFFSLGGAMRGRPEEAADLFEAAYQEDPQTAVRTLFYLRDIRGGQGEREIFRAGLRRLDKLTGDIQTGSWLEILGHIPEYGRWDDLLALGVRADVCQVIHHQLKDDLIAYSSSPLAPVSLLAKWLPSENASSEETKARARRLIEWLGMSPAEYRRNLSRLRARIRLLEHDMSSNNWNAIDYGKLPSQAHRKHVKAFQRHTPERYQAYLDSVEKGEAKINVSTVYPYEIWRMVFRNDQEKYANVAWENLPDYTRGNDALVMADVSASMTWEQNALAMATAISLALYFAERNEGAMKGYFMTFASNPELIKVSGRTLRERMQNIMRSPIGGSTDVLAAFRAILRATVKSGEKPPSTLYIISDMQFNRCAGNTSDTTFQIAKQEFEQAGLELPHVVFWNVNARQTQAPATIFDGNVSLVSGCSPTIFSMAVEGKSPRQLVDEVVNSPRYDRIVL